jgi:hypothetical protein
VKRLLALREACPGQKRKAAGDLSKDRLPRNNVKERVLLYNHCMKAIDKLSAIAGAKHQHPADLTCDLGN